MKWQDGKYDEAATKYTEALKMSGFSAELAYNLAVCLYRMKNYVGSLKHVADIIERGIREYPGTKIT